MESLESDSRIFFVPGIAYVGTTELHDSPCKLERERLRRNQESHPTLVSCAADSKIFPSSYHEELAQYQHHHHHHPSSPET